MYVLISSYRGVLFYGDFPPQIIAISVALPLPKADHAGLSSYCDLHSLQYVGRITAGCEYEFTPIEF